MADGAIISSTVPEAFTQVRGEIAATSGDVVLIRPSGEIVTARAGLKIFLNDTLSSRDDSAVLVNLSGQGAFSVSQNQQLLISQAFLDRLQTPEREGSLEQAISLGALEQAIAEGRSIEDILPATAAGAESVEESENVLIFYQRTADALIPVSGFTTNNFADVNTIRINEFGTTADADSNNALDSNSAPLTTNATNNGSENTVITGNVPAAVDADGTIASYNLMDSVATGTLTFNADGSYSYDPGTAFENLAPGDSAEVTFSYTATDDDGSTSAPATITITVAGENDNPESSDSAATIDEDNSYSFQASDFAFSDIDGGQTVAAIRVDTLPAAGTLLLNGAAVSAGALVSLADIQAGNLLFTPAANANGTPYTSFTFSVQDSAGGFDTTPNVFTLNVNPVNDAPVAQNDIVSTAINTPINNINILANDSDVDNANTELTLSAVTLADPSSGGLSVNPDATLNFSPAADFSGAVIVNYTLTDPEGLSTSASLTINVGDNTLPEGSDGSVTIDEDVSYTLVDANFGFSDADAGQTFANVRIDTLPAAGSLSLSGSPVVAGQLISLLDIQSGNLLFTPAANANGAAYSNFTFSVQDSSGAFDDDSNTFTFNVSPINDAPVVSSNGLSVIEDSDDNSLGLSVPTDVDGDSLTITVTGLPALGIVTLADGSPVSNGQTLSAAELTGLQYDAPADYDGVADPGDFTYSVDDGQGAANSVQTGSVDITMTPINDAPVNSVPGSVSVDEDTRLLFTGSNTINVTDVDGNLASTQVTVVNGTLSLSLSGSATISAGASGSSSLTISGSETDINASLASLSYQGNADFNGADTLTVVSTDSAGTPLSDTDTVAITVNPVLDITYIRISQDTATIDELLGVVTYSVELLDGTGPSAAPVVVPAGELITVNLSYAGSTASAADYSVEDSTGPLPGLPAQITVSPGSSAASFTVSAEEDALIEVNETLVVTVAGGINDSGAIEALLIHPNNQVTTTIIDNDVVAVTAVSDAQALEGANLVHTITLNGTSATDETYNLSISPQISDLILSDYDLLNLVLSDGVSFVAANPPSSDGVLTGVLSVPAGVSTFTVSILAADDFFNEVVESYTLVIDGVNATGTIIDTDLPSLGDINATVYESGLSGGTAEFNPAAPVVASGNIFAGVLDISDTDIIASVGSATPDADGIITLNSTTLDESGASVNLSSLVVYTEDFGGNVAGDYVYTLLNNTLDHSLGAVTETFTFVVQSDVNPDGSVNTTSADLIVAIEDDVPTGFDVTENLSSAFSLVTTNLHVAVDVSGSLSNADLQTVIDALTQLIHTADAAGNVNVQLVVFGGGAAASPAFIDDVDAAIDWINGLLTDRLVSVGATDYEAALTALAAANTANPLPASADQDLMYFISDGEHNAGAGIEALTHVGSSGMSVWEQYVADHFDVAYSVGIGADAASSEAIGYLSDVAYDPQNPNRDGDGDMQEDTVILLDSTADLTDALLSGFGSGEVTGDLSNTASSFVDSGFLVGADDGYISQLVVDGTIYNYDAVSSVSGAQSLIVITALGGELSFDFLTGEYQYTIDIDTDSIGEQENFVATLTDYDGDTSTINFTIDLEFSAAIDADRDTLLTNDTDGSAILIPEAALMWNDQSQGATISAVSNPVNGSVSGSATVSFDPSALLLSGDDFESATAASMMTEGAGDSEATPQNNTLATAVDFTDRALFSLNDSAITDDIDDAYSAQFSGSLTSD
nr:retention module-containing protein [Cellvibrionaceae bacterium]